MDPPIKSTVTLLAAWFASALSGPWFHTTYRPQPLKVLDIGSLTSKQASLYRYESHSFDQTEIYLFAKIRLPKLVQENFVLTSQSRLNNAEIDRDHKGMRSDFDDGLFNFAHTKLGFATNEDRRFENAVLDLARVKKQVWAKLAQSPADIDVRVDFIEPQITAVADIPFKGGEEIIFRDQIFNIGTKFFNNSRFVISLKGIARDKLMMGVVLYNPILKEIVLTEAYSGGGERMATYLNRPKLRNFNTQWQASVRGLPQGATTVSSTGYTIIAKSPSKEWLEQARIKVYKVDLSVPVTRALKFDRVDLSDIPLAD